MVQTGHSQIGCKHKVGSFGFVEKIASQVININANLIEYVTKMLANK